MIIFKRLVDEYEHKQKEEEQAQRIESLRQRDPESLTWSERCDLCPHRNRFDDGNGMLVCTDCRLMVHLPGRSNHPDTDYNDHVLFRNDRDEDQQDQVQEDQVQEEEEDQPPKLTRVERQRQRRAAMTEEERDAENLKRRVKWGSAKPKGKYNKK